MAFDGQMAGVIVLVALAAAYIVRSLWGILHGKKSCCSHGCQTNETASRGDLISEDELTARLHSQKSPH
ncbi:MAG: hypothetical protein KatS3mg105_4793 [Gemmatales bacterium]|nr:MAG: hypothetical protein KatS3mg105_4793 [Gemmatales bacterium]